MKKTFLSHTEAAIRNRNMLLHYIKKNSHVSRTDIWENFNISRGSVTEIIKQLQESKLIKEKGMGESKGGRKPVFLAFDGSKTLFFAFQWSAQTLFLMNLSGKILSEEKISFPDKFSPEEFTETILSHAEKMKKKTGENIEGIVLELPGIIDAKNAAVVYSIELGWQDVNLKNMFGECFKYVCTERTSNILALAELSKHTNKNTTHLQLFILDKHGIGVSTIIHGKLQHGAGCMHGELGHIKLPFDVPCSCGQNGCLEAIVAKTIKENGGEITNQVLDYLAIGVSTAINICDTDALLVGSYVDNMSHQQKQYFADAVHSRVTSNNMRKFNIIFSHDRHDMAQRGLCEYIFECMFPI